MTIRHGLRRITQVRFWPKTSFRAPTYAQNRTCRGFSTYLERLVAAPSTHLDSEASPKNQPGFPEVEERFQRLAELLGISTGDALEMFRKEKHRPSLEVFFMKFVKTWVPEPENMWTMSKWCSLSK